MKFLTKLFAALLVGGFLGLPGVSVANEYIYDYDYYDAYDYGYDDNYGDDWFYDTYTYGDVWTSPEYEYEYDWVENEYEWEEDDLFFDDDLE